MSMYVVCVCVSMYKSYLRLLMSVLVYMPPSFYLYYMHNDQHSNIPPGDSFSKPSQ